MFAGSDHGIAASLRFLPTGQTRSLRRERMDANADLGRRGDMGCHRALPPNVEAGGRPRRTGTHLWGGAEGGLPLGFVQKQEGPIERILTWREPMRQRGCSCPVKPSLERSSWSAHQASLRLRLAIQPPRGALPSPPSAKVRFGPGLRGLLLARTHAVPCSCQSTMAPIEPRFLGRSNPPRPRVWSMKSGGPGGVLKTICHSRGHRQEDCPRHRM